MKQIKILMVDDNDADIYLTKRAFEKSKINATLDAVYDGEEALEYLEKNLPSLILLDINMPKMNGFELLEIIKSNEHYKHIPVLMLTTSSDQEDIFKSYSRYASSFISKPVKIENFVNAIKSIENYWVSFVKLPEK